MVDEQELHDHNAAFVGMHSHDGGAAHWHDEFGAHLSEDLTDEERAARSLDWQMHNTTIVTIGMDIGSSTSHLMFSRLFVQLVGDGGKTRSIVVGREVLAESRIVLTPFLPDNTIDTVELQHLVVGTYIASQAGADDVDSGAIILTGEALKRENARGIAELFAFDTGKFVTASAGHHMEAVLAANGSGTVARSRRDGQTLLNVDIGGGTTKFALVSHGEVIATAAIAIGGRLLVLDEQRHITRLAEPARQFASTLGIELAEGSELSVEDETRLVEAWASIVADVIERRPLSAVASKLLLTDALPLNVAPSAVTFSGGVSEFFYRREKNEFGDLGRPIAEALRRAIAKREIRTPVIMDANPGIRATAIGASQFTVQLGVNLSISDEAMLPLENVVVLEPRITLNTDSAASEVATALRAAMTRVDFAEGDDPVAITLEASEPLPAETLRTIAEGLRAALPLTVEEGLPIVLLVNDYVGSTLGSTLVTAIDESCDVLALEGVMVREFDFIDVAPLIHPSEVVPITIKSLLFAGGLDRRSVKQALYEAAMDSVDADPSETLRLRW